jgi:hypothetical protein
MRSLITKIEADLGLSVIIAGHPKTSPKNAHYMYGNALFIQNKTPELIFQSKWVIACTSTAVSFAVRMRKPLTFITTDEIEQNNRYRNIVASMSSWFGLPRINIDHLNDNDALKIPNINEKYYVSFETSFLLKNGVKDEFIWREVAHQHEKYISRLA